MARRFDNHFLSFGIGFSMHMAATVSLWIDSTVESELIFLRAEIIAYLSFVSNTLHASARYSLLRDIASLMIG